jgi:ADP-ribosylglycohydrolase
MPSEFLSQNEIAVATLVRSTEFNPQDQTRIVWPDNSLVARAYLDQLTRSKAIQPERSRTVSELLDRADNPRNRNAAAAVEQLGTVATDFERDATTATGIDAARMRSLAATLRSRAARRN